MAAITSIVSLNQLVTWFEAFADNHFFLKDFGFGEPYDIGTTRQMEFPYMWLTLDDTSVIATGTNIKSAIPDYSFRVFFMDKINIQENYLDQNGFQSDNSQEIISDTIQYLQDLITYIQQEWGQYGVLLSADVTFSPVIDETQDKSTGISASITLRTRQVNCVIPEAPGNIVVQPNQATVETLLTCESLGTCDTFTGATTKYYGSFYDTTIQGNSGATSANTMTYNTTDFASGVSVVNNGRITIANGGKYNIQFSAQFDKTDSGADDVEVWLSKNGNNLTYSSTVLTLDGNNAKMVAAWNWFVEVNSGDYFEIKWHSNDTDMRILSRTTQSNPDRPAIPSVILTVNKID